MELNIDNFGRLEPIVGLQVKVIRIWTYEDDSYVVEIVRESNETFSIRFPQDTNIHVLANCKTAYITGSRIAYIDCKVDIHFSTQYIKIY